MKTVVSLLIFLLLFNFSPTNAQGIYQFWGNTANGGSDDIGAMFSMDGSGNNFQVRHNYVTINPGAYPGYSEPVEYNGKFYGMSIMGGSNNMGVIFQWDPATNVYTKKFDFGSTTGYNPQGSLFMYGGKFYGMTQYGGLNDAGVIFEWDPSTHIYIKHIDLDPATGSQPYGSLRIKDGKFYGMTNRGGANDVGVIFEWDPATNIYTKKMDFLNGPNGRNPYGSLTLKDGKFYGMATRGGIGVGVIFEWDPATNIYTKKISFNYTDGSTPFGDLTWQGSRFYGMTYSGGISDQGVIFEWDPVTNDYVKQFETTTFSNGRHFKGNLKWKDGKFYGMAQGHVQGSDPTPRSGVIFEWDPATNVYTKKIDLTIGTGNYPQGSMVLSNDKFYGLMQQGGSNNSGVLFEYDPAANVYTKKIDFNGNDGRNPRGLTNAAGKLYGMTQWGGDNYTGLIYEWDPSTEIYTKRANLGAAEGSNPLGNLTFANGKLYGITQKGGSGNGGVIFEFDPATQIYTKKIDFNGADGYRPDGNLTYVNGKFYGMTEQGGNNSVGVIFEWDPVSNVYTKKFDFDGPNGRYPYGSLSLLDGKLYGITGLGGSFSSGVIFEWDPASNMFTKKADFDGSNGDYPRGNLSLFDGKFFGVTDQGGTHGGGVIFEWNPSSNILTKKFDFDNAAGEHPFGSLTLNAGKFYGMTSEGGIHNDGVVFEWDPSSNQYAIKKNFERIEAGYPSLGNDLTLTPAPVAKGTAGTCVSFAPVTIDNSNNNIWVPIIDEKGDAVAEIKANGNNLGVVTSSMFINGGAVREDNLKRLYLDRNLTITPAVQPTTAVDIRLYIKRSEYLALKNAVNSLGQPSAVNSVNEIGIFKNDDPCLAAVASNYNAVATTSADWVNDHVFTASITSFSSFYFFNKAVGAPLPVSSLEFTGRLQNKDAVLSWKTTDEVRTHSFDLERSTDGRIYNVISNTAAFNQPGVHTYSYNDDKISGLGSPIVYYRLKQIDTDGRFSYSQIVALNMNKSVSIMLYPNPVVDKVNLTVTINQAERLQARIIDNTGRVIQRFQWDLPAGSTSLPINAANYAKGLYYLELSSESIHERKRFMKD